MSDTYDYIVIGGGTAGPVIATRLSEDPSNSVVILEAGKENTKEAMFYANGAGQMWQGETNWGYSSIAQDGLDGRSIMQPRGKLIGGSASINVGSWARGNSANYNSWNLDGWGWDTVLQWYLKIEDSDRGANEFRGGSGPMKLEVTPQGTYYLTQVFKQACIETGIGATDDLNGKDNQGFDLWQSIFRNGRRHNTVINYLDGARMRANLAIETEAFVSKIVIENGKAVAVEYSQGGVVKRVEANKEIILCAGAFNSPQILMHSGVGPGNVLQGFGIEVKKDLPGVGANLADHLRVDVGVTSPDGVGVSLRANAEDPAQLAEWRRTGYGPLAVAENTSAAFFKSSPDVPIADLEMMFNINAPAPMGAPPPENAGYYINVGLVQPKSRGSIRLASAEPQDAPLIDPNYLAEEADAKACISGIRAALALTQTKSLAGFTDPETLTIQPTATDYEILTYIKGRGESIYHPVGTATMGADSDPMAVLNTKLQVRGVDNLRVADASSIPNLISGHTMAPTILVAERAADFIMNGG